MSELCMFHVANHKSFELFTLVENVINLIKISSKLHMKAVNAPVLAFNFQSGSIKINWGRQRLLPRASVLPKRDKPLLLVTIMQKGESFS